MAVLVQRHDVKIAPIIMSDPISKLRGLTSEIKAKEEELRAYFKNLEQQLKDATGGYSITGQSENCTLETYGDDDAYYGYLSFDVDRLTVAYRTRQEDMEVLPPRHFVSAKLKRGHACLPESHQRTSA